MKKLIILCFFGVLFLNSGCASYMAKQSWNDAQQQKAFRVEADGSQVMVGVDLTKMSYLKDNWPMAVGAGVIDAGLLYGAYSLYDEVSDSSSGNSPKQSAGRDNTSVSVTGDGNTVQIRGDASTFN